MAEKQWMAYLDKTRKNTNLSPMFYDLTCLGFPKLQLQTSIARQCYQLPFTDLDSNFPSFTMALTKKKRQYQLSTLLHRFLQLAEKISRIGKKILHNNEQARALIGSLPVAIG